MNHVSFIEQMRLFVAVQVKEMHLLQHTIASTLSPSMKVRMLVVAVGTVEITTTTKILMA